MSAAARISSNSWSETRMKIRLPRVRPVLCCWFLPMGLTLLSMFPDVAAVSPFDVADIAGDVETTVTAQCAAPSKSLRHSGQCQPPWRGWGNFGLCAQTV